MGNQQWGTGEWIEKSAKFKINDINYREVIYSEKGNFDVIDCRVEVHKLTGGWSSRVVFQ